MTFLSQAMDTIDKGYALILIACVFAAVPLGLWAAWHKPPVR